MMPKRFKTQVVIISLSISFLWYLSKLAFHAPMPN